MSSYSQNVSYSVSTASNVTPPITTKMLKELLHKSKFEEAYELLSHIPDTSASTSLTKKAPKICDSFLHTLVSINDVPESLIDLAIAKATNLNVLDKESASTPLMSAATNGQVQAAQKLLQAGARVDLTDRDGLNLLHISALNGDTQMLELFLPLLPSQINTIAKGDFGLLEDLGQVPERDNSDEDNVYSYARRRARFDPYDEPDIQYLTEDELEPRSDYFPNEGMTPLLCAIESSIPGCVKLLLEHGADPNIAKTTPDLHSPLCSNASGAYHSGPNSVVIHQLLCAFGAREQPDANGYTPFLLAAKNANLPLFTLFLEQGADPDAIHHLREFDPNKSSHQRQKIYPTTVREVLTKNKQKINPNTSFLAQRFENVWSVLEAFDLRRALTQTTIPEIDLEKNKKMRL